MRTELVLEALQMAIDERQPIQGLIYHSDRGSQYAARASQELLNEHGMVCSMSRKGDCWDNAVAESFFSNIKNELTYWRIFNDRDEARSAIFDYIEVFYNRQRRHSHIGQVAPLVFESAELAAR